MDESVIDWVRALTDGDEQAAQQLWDEYFRKLVRLADMKLKGVPRRAVDEEDIALCAMDSFVRGAQDGRFPRIADRTDLWNILATITIRKVMAEQRRHYAKKRGGGQVRGESVFLNRGTDIDGKAGIEQILGSGPTPEMAAQLADHLDQLLAMLKGSTIRKVAMLKLEGYTNLEISQKIGCHEGTVERKLASIRQKWNARLAEEK